MKRLADDIHRTHGHIDILVNDIWGAEVLKGGPSEWNTPLWNHDLQKGLRILRLGVETHLITSHHLLPLVIARPGGLLVEVTDGTFEYNSTHYRLSTFYDLAKISVNRLAFSQGHELEAHGATAVSISPGWLRSEMMLETYGVSEETGVTRSRRLPRRRLLPDLPFRSHRDMSAVQSPPWRQIPSVTGGTSDP